MFKGAVGMIGSGGREGEGLRVVYLTIATACCSSAAADTAANDVESSPLTIFSMDFRSLLVGDG